MDQGLCLVLSPSRRSVWYKAQEVLDYLHGNFAILENGFEFDIEGFENENDDDNDDLP